MMQTNIIKDILNLKENEGYSILRLGIKKEDNIAFVIEADANFSDIFEECLEELTMANMQLFNIYKDEVLKDLDNLNEVDTLTTLSISVIADNEGNTIAIYTPYISIYKDEANELIELIQNIQSKLDKKLNDILSKFVDKEDNLKNFELVFKRDSNGKLKYYDFNRLCDRKISQQKNEIRELLSSEFEEKLINEANELGYELSKIEKEQVVFIFNTDMKEIFDLKLAVY